MHNNFYFLKLLRSELNSKISNSVIKACFSQNKDELILSFTSLEEEFYIKAALNNDFCCLSFPEEYFRSKKNSVDLFTEIIGKRVSGVKQFLNERSFTILFEGNFQLLFKMHGNRSNVILLKNNQPLSVFKSHLKKDYELDISTLDREINQNKDHFLNSSLSYDSLFPTFGKHIKKHLHHLGYEDLKPEKQWKCLQDVLDELQLGKFYIVRNDSDIYFSLLKEENAELLNHSPITAITQFYGYFTREYYLKKEKNEVLKALNLKLSKTKNYIKKSELKLKGLVNGSNYKELADVIMANLYNIPSNSERVKLFNFYTNEDEEISLNKKLSPQKNAENFYRKSKNQKLEIDNISSTIENKCLEVEKQTNLISEITETEDIRFLRKFLKREQVSKKVEVKPYFVFSIADYEIRVGKNSKNNDLLTFKFAHKEDLWLHAKDVAGSHVVIKQKNGQKTPDFVIEKAAEIAAYYSKRKTDSLCPVIVTPRKFLRKPKGFLPGKVLVEKESVVMVRPKKPE